MQLRTSHFAFAVTSMSFLVHRAARAFSVSGPRVGPPYAFTATVGGGGGGGGGGGSGGFGLGRGATARARLFASASERGGGGGGGGGRGGEGKGKGKGKGRRSKQRTRKPRADGLLPRGEGPFAYHDEVVVEILDLSNQGDGVGRVDLPGDGQGGLPSKYVIMVPGTMPGEVVRARVWQNFKSHSVADLVEITTPSPKRVQPLCPLFGECGGCQYQFMAIEDQRAWKRKHVKEVLTRIGGVPLADDDDDDDEDGGGGGGGGGPGRGGLLVVGPVVGSAEVYGYRTKLTPHHGRPDPETGDVGPIGFQRKGARGENLVDVAQCPIATSQVNARLTALRAEVRAEAVAQVAMRTRVVRLEAEAEEAAAKAAKAEEEGEGRGGGEGDGGGGMGRESSEGGETPQERGAVESTREAAAPSPSSSTTSPSSSSAAVGLGVPHGGGGGGGGSTGAPLTDFERQQARRKLRGATLLLRHATRRPAAEPRGMQGGGGGGGGGEAEGEAATATAATTATEEGAAEEEGYVCVDPNGEVEERVAGELFDLTFRFRAGEFFQNNPFVVPRLVDHVVRQAALTPLQLEGGGEGQVRSVVDAYCGGGLFALACAQQAAQGAPLQVQGVEISGLNVASAAKNAARNGLSASASFTEGTAEAIFAQVTSFDPAVTAVILDPPRKGCSPEFLEQLLAFQPARVVYVSCDPATQARDARALLGSGAYAAVQCTPFDLFPQTRHIENVLTFDRRKGGTAPG